MPTRTPLFLAMLALSVPSALLAQDGKQDIEEIVVTGSRIPRPDFQSASPIASIDSEAFKRTASSSVESVLSRLPQFVPEYGASSNNPGLGGISTVQLRGLGAQSTLTLLDGRRLIPATGMGAVDVNIIPPALIERVEVVTGGASAVYGSDAVAGVVNFRLRRSFEGVQVEGSWGQTAEDDGEESSVGITAGTSFAEGRGQVYGYLGYAERDEVLQSERGFSEYVLEWLGPGLGTTGPDQAFFEAGFIPVGEALIRAPFDPVVWDSVFFGYGFAPGQVPYTRGLTGVGLNADGTVFAAGGRDFEGAPQPPGSVANFRGETDPRLFNDRIYTYNTAPWSYLQVPLERTSAFGRASFELSPTAELYAQALYADYSSGQQLAASPSSGNRLYIPRTNPYITEDLGRLLDSRPDPAAPIQYTKRFVELGPRAASNDYQVVQATAGLRGELFGRWHYDAYAQYGDNDQRETRAGNVSKLRLAELLDAPDGGRSICGEFNVFRTDAISAECADYMSTDGTNRSGYRQYVYEASIVGPVWSLPGGEMELVLGLMHKRDEYFYDADPISGAFLPDGTPAYLGFNASDDIEGSDHNTDAYLELSLPLLADSAGAVALEALLGYRYTYYDSAGSADSWKAELMYQPLESLRLRGSMQRAVRAPSVHELYLPRLPTLYFWDFGFYDACAADSRERTGSDAAAVTALCLAQGVPQGLIDDFIPADGFDAVVGGNPELEPESAKTLTLGAVFSPATDQALFADLQLGIDWFRIEIDDTIDAVDAFTYVPSCYDRDTNPELSAAGYWCGFFARDPASGNVVDAVDTLVNYSTREVSGIDLNLDWQIPAGPGTIGFTALASWLDSFEISPLHGLPSTDRTGMVGSGIGGSQPEWKLNIGLGYLWRELHAGLQWRYIAAMDDADRNAQGVKFRVPSQDYLDAFVEASFDAGALEGLTARAGVENLTDEIPPVLLSQVQANTDPSQYDTLGRRYYINLSYHF